MGAKFVNVDRDTELLLPPNMREWVPANHLVHFILEAVEQFDVSAARVNERGSGSEQYPSAMMLALLTYSYATGVFSSRQIERSTYENVAVRVLCADTHPDHDTICAFRRHNAALLSAGFTRVLELAAHCGVLKVGDITVAVDGTKVLANASRHTAVSHGHATEQLRLIEEEVKELMARAEQADAAPLQDGLSIEGELARRHQRRARLEQARAAIEARVRAKAQAQRGCEEPSTPPPSVDPKEQINLTDADSRIMPCGGSGRFEQCYNAQAAVEVDSRLIVGARVCDAPNDKQQLVPSVRCIAEAAGPVREVLVDSGFVSEEAIRDVENTVDGQPTGITVLAAVGRIKHGRSIAELEKPADAPAPPPDAPFKQRLAHRVATAYGRARYKLRQQTVEPVFGIIKEAMGWRRFMLRGMSKVSLEWTLVSLAYNLRRLHRLGAKLQHP
jgi:transposase